MGAKEVHCIIMTDALAYAQSVDQLRSKLREVFPSNEDGRPANGATRCHSVPAALPASMNPPCGATIDEQKLDKLPALREVVA